MKRPLYNKQSLTESGVYQLENIVIHNDRQKLMFYEYSILSVIIQKQNIFLIQSLHIHIYIHISPFYIN